MTQSVTPALHVNQEPLSGVGEIIQEEKFRGDKIANRFRYVLFLLFIPGLLIDSTGKIWGMVILGIFLAFTLLHSISIFRKAEGWINRLSFVAIGLDLALIFGICLYYQQVWSPDNMAYFFKQPIIFYFVLPGCLILIQFRKQLLLLFALFLFAGMGIVVYFAVNSGLPQTTSWYDYIQGEAIYLSAFLILFSQIMLTLILTIWYSVNRTERMVKRIARLEVQKNSLSRYFPAPIAQQILEDPELVNKGRRLKVTVLFSDIRDFTSISESISTEELVGHLSAYREFMVEEIFNQQGTVDKFIGDGIMAVFGAPYPSGIAGEDTRRAVEAGKAMLEKVKTFNQARGLIGDKAWDMGIGIHTGQVFAGNIGHQSMFEYSILGDTVNTAARIEGLCKTLGSRFLVSEEIKQELGEGYLLRSMGDVMVKGKAQALKVFAMD